MHAALESRTNEIYQHLVAGDESACHRYIDRIRSEDGVSVLTVCEQLTEAFQSMGDAWACSEIGVYREHVARQIGCRLLLDLSSSLPAVSETAPKAIGCTPESDPYLESRGRTWKEPKMGMMCSMAKKMEAKKRKQHLRQTETFLENLS